MAPARKKSATKSATRKHAPSNRKNPIETRPTLAQLHARVQAESSVKDAEFLQRFFKTGAGQYGEGDRFLGIRVPVLRKLAREFRSLGSDDVWRLLKSRWHEERLLALILIVELHARSSESERDAIGAKYLEHACYINNWDLVDSSAEHVVGPMIARRGLPWLKRLAKSPMLWERRIAMLATFDEIKANEFTAALSIAECLLNDKEDLMHKAVGWMLREIGKRDRAVERGFLDKHCAHMPRTALRYALEHFPSKERERYMKAKVAPAG